MSRIKNNFSLMCLLMVAACGGSGDAPNGSSESTAVVITSFELVDPTPSASDGFGFGVIVLATGNVVVTDPQDSSRVTSGGAVHLYDPRTKTRVSSIYGDSAGDQLGLNGVTALPNGNYVIASANDDVGGRVDAGSVRLMDGTTGAQIGSALEGDQASDLIGSSGVTVLGNEMYVVASSSDQVGAVVRAGSVRVINATTGLQVGTTFAGDQVNDSLGSHGVTALTNGNFVIASAFDDVGGVINAGSAILVNGLTGTQVGIAIAGDQANDQIGLNHVTALSNGNYVIASSNDDFGGVAEAGTIVLVDGITGLQIGSVIAGDNFSDLLGWQGATALSNGNFVVGSSVDDVGGVVDAGSVMLFNGATGAQIGATLAGDLHFDHLGTSVVALDNGNYVVASYLDHVGFVSKAGSVMLFNGATGAQIGSAIAGDQDNDRLGSNGVTALTSGNYVIASSFDGFGGAQSAGSLMLVDGSTGAQIGSTFAGDQASDGIASGGVVALGNGNFLVVSEFDDANGLVDAGSVMMFNGVTGVQIGTAVTGSVAGDINSAKVTSSSNLGFHVLAFPNWDNTGGVDSGLVRLVAN